MGCKTPQMECFVVAAYLLSYCFSEQWTAFSAVQHAFSEARVSVDEVMAGMLGTIHIVLYCNQTFRKWCKKKKNMVTHQMRLSLVR